MKLLRSKWFYYGLIGLVLTIVLVILVYYSVNGNEMTWRFVPTVSGLLVTLFIFTVFFDVRDWLEWKPVKSRVLKMIANQLDAISGELLIMCDVNLVVSGKWTEEGHKKRRDEELQRMANNTQVSQSVVDDLFTMKDMGGELATYFEKHRILLSEIEMKYTEFLDSQLQDGLMEIQENLGILRYALKVKYAKKERFHEDLSKIISKILKAIVKAKERLPKATVTGST
jgi:hypothetical protein